MGKSVLSAIIQVEWHKWITARMKSSSFSHWCYVIRCGVSSRSKRTFMIDLNCGLHMTTLTLWIQWEQESIWQDPSGSSTPIMTIIFRIFTSSSDGNTLHLFTIASQHQWSLVAFMDYIVLKRRSTRASSIFKQDHTPEIFETPFYDRKR